MPTSLITVVIPFPAERMSAVDALIESLSSTKEGNIPREEIRHRLDQLQRVHYMSIVAVDGRCPAAASEPGHARDPERSEAAHLVIEVTADGSVHEALEVLAGSMGAELESVLAASSIERGGELLETFLFRHYRPIGPGWSLKRALGQVHLGAPGMTVRRILQEQELAQWLGEEVRGLSASPRWHDEMSPIQRLQAIRELAWSRGDKWAFVPEPAPCLPADPSNPWNDSGYSVGNPQARKAFWDILHTLLWPLYLPLALAWVLLSWSSWQDGWNMTAVIWTLFVAFVLLLSLVLTILALYRRLRHYETRDLADDIVPPAAQVEALMKEENHFAQNHMATVSRLKPSLIRRLALRVAFVVVGTGRFVGAPGFLGKNGVIHVARWMRLPGTSQLMFWSNFDGTWESYVADFIADAPTGVTAIWSNCRGFPKTAHLFRDGAEQRDKLVNWARRQQHPTRFWYSAYPDLTGARIRNNAALRQGLASAMSDADARDWLALFGSSQRPADALDLPEIPTLVFGGLMKRRHARCLLVHWRGGAEQACRWLSVVERDATFGETRPGHLAVAVALASSGLKKLGLPDDAMATFPTAFQQDMWPSWRARALGDEAVNDPRNWTWGPGGADNESHADAVVLVYAFTAESLEEKCAGYVKAAAECGHHVIDQVPLFLDQPATGSGLPNEPFGFADGVSQPVIRGAPRQKVNAVDTDVVAPGEIVLGYPDNIGEIPPTPALAARDDPRHFLPDKGTDPFRRRPEFSRYEPSSSQRDLGANGTYLVIRQLAQDREAFREWCEEAYDELKRRPDVHLDVFDDEATLRSLKLAAVSGQPPAQSEEGKRREGIRLIASLLTGRWPDGSSLVRNPRSPATRSDPSAKPDNAFLFGSEDPRGLACPFGAHIRRANPRDTRFHRDDEETKTELEAINRHRMLRIGRSWGDRAETDPGNAKGLMFMCLNADIERQFEFVQKTWLLNRNMHGLEDEVDPIIGINKDPAHPRVFTVPTTSGPIKLKIRKDFVKVVGGGYFFMPGRATLRYLVRRGARQVDGAQEPSSAAIALPPG